MKKSITILVLLALSFPALAKKDKAFELPGREKQKTVDQKIFAKDWSRSLKAGDSSKRYYPETSAPVSDGGTIYVGTHGGTFYAIDETSGKTSWKFENSEPISSTAAVTGDKIVFADLGGNVVCLGKAGNQIWRVTLDREMLGKPLINAGRVYLLKGENTVVALSLDSGTVIWQKDIRTFVKDITMRGHASFLADAGGLFVGLADGHLYKVSLADGHVIWDKALAVPLKTFKDIDAQVTIDGDSLYVGGYSGAFYRINKDSGGIAWSTDVATGVAPVIYGDTVVVADTSGNLIGLDKKTGKEQWLNELGGDVLSAPALVDGKIFVASFKDGAFVFEPTRGTQLQEVSVGDGSINAPLVNGNRLYVLTNSASLVALEKR